MSDHLEGVLEHLGGDGVVIHPTETVYGLAAPVTPGGVAALRRLKGREPGRPFLLLVADDAAGRAWLEGLEWTDAARALARRFWPGPVTLILFDEQGRVPEGAVNPQGGVAVRVTPHPLAGALLERWGRPLLSTSANRPGVPPVRSADEARREFAAEIEEGTVVVVDGGALEPSAPSTLVDCTGHRPRVIREGAVTTEILTMELGGVQ